MVMAMNNTNNTSWVERETEDFVFIRHNDGRLSYRYKKQQDYNTLMNHIKETALCRYVDPIPYPESWLENGHFAITENDLYGAYPNMPNVDYELLRTWWGVYRPIAEDTYYAEFFFGEDGEGDEPNDRELLVCFIMRFE